MLNFLDDACPLPGMYARLPVIAKFGYDAEKPISDDAKKKTLAEATQLLESVLVQSSKTTLTSETLKTKLREVLEKPQELSKENGKDDTELRVLEKPQELIKENGKDDTELRGFAAKFDNLDAAVQLQQGTGSLETECCGGQI